jgi:pilus assembly protein CpaE
VVLLDYATVKDDLSKGIHDILSASPETCLIVTATQVSPSIVSRAVTAGARGFLVKPYDKNDLVNTVHDSFVNLVELRRLQQTKQRPTSPSHGQIIAVYSPKGGVGCTTIATNVAVALRSRTKKSVAIVDLDLQFGDVGVALDLRGANSIAELVGHAGAIDRALLDEVLVHHESGVRALLAPDTLDAMDQLDGDRIVEAIEELRNHFDYVVCDLWSTLDELTLSTLRLADRIVLVTTPELPSLKNIRRVIAATTPLLLDERTLVVVNRHPGKAGISIEDIEKNLGHTVNATIPSEGVGVTRAINQGISTFDARAHVRASKSFQRLADLVSRHGEETPSVQVARAASA